MFEYILEHDEEFEGSVLNEARGYQNILTDFQFVFCLNIFSAVFGLTTVLYDIVQSKQFDIAYCITKVQETKNRIQELRNNFESSWNSTLEVADAPKRRGQTEQEVKASFRQIFFSVIDTTVVQIHIRFETLNSRKFVSLLDHSKHELYCRNFPEEELNSLQATYGSFFNIQALKSELTVVYASAELESKPVFDMIKKIIELDLQRCFPEVYRLCQLILTIPSTSASAERSFSALKRIKTYLRSTQGQDRLSALATISIEKELLTCLQGKPEFYDNVIKEFCAKERRMEFTFTVNSLLTF